MRTYGKTSLFCIHTHFVWWWLCELNWWETTGSCRQAETLTTGTPIQTQWQTLWWHLLLLRKSTSALNKACNHTVVTWEQTKQCRHTVSASYTYFTYSQMSVFTYLILVYQRFHIKTQMETNSYLEPLWLITGHYCTCKKVIYNKKLLYHCYFLHTPACNFLHVRRQEKERSCT